MRPVLNLGMCANYIPSNRDALAQHFGVDPRTDEFKPETYPGYLAPIIRLSYDNPASGQLEVVPAMFGMVPAWADESMARHCYNSRSETTASKPAFRHAWQQRQFCIIPVETIFEPSYETGTPVRWGIRHKGTAQLGVAGIWEAKSSGPDKPPLLSFSMLTINADEHPVWKFFHKPTDEKRSVVVLQPHQYDAWIHASADEAASFLLPFPAEQLVAAPAPKTKARPAQSSLDF